MTLLVVGTLAFDSVQTPFGQREQVLGGSASFLGVAASYFTQVMMSGVVGEDFPKEHLDFFNSCLIDMSGIKALPGKTFRWRGHYTHDLSTATTLETQLNVLANFKPELPAAFRQAPYVMLGNIDPVLQTCVLDQLENPVCVACDTMNYWIERYNQPLRKTLERIHLLSINEAEARQLSGQYNLLKAAQIIQDMGPKIVVIKRGEYGVLLFYHEQVCALPGYLLETIHDPTGAGDTFAGGLMGYLASRQQLNAETLRQAIVVGSVMASFVVEDFSLDRLRNLNRQTIRDRIEHFQQIIAVPTGASDVI